MNVVGINPLASSGAPSASGVAVCSKLSGSLAMGCAFGRSHGGVCVDAARVLVI